MERVAKFRSIFLLGCELQKFILLDDIFFALIHLSLSTEASFLTQKNSGKFSLFPQTTHFPKSTLLSHIRQISLAKKLHRFFFKVTWNGFALVDVHAFPGMSVGNESLLAWHLVRAFFAGVTPGSANCRATQLACTHDALQLTRTLVVFYPSGKRIDERKIKIVVNFSAVFACK